MKPPPLVEAVVNGPVGPCMTLIPQTQQQNETVRAWLATVHDPACPAQAAPAGGGGLQVLDPVTLAEQFWLSIPLPVPHPSIPPGYAITGKTAYLVTGGTTAPPPYVEQTPLGTLTIIAKGSYYIDWGDPASPGLAGPYTVEGQPYPTGVITHVYDYVGTDRVVVEERWTATWTLDGAAGTLGGLHTTGTIAAYPVRQLQAVITS